MSDGQDSAEPRAVDDLPRDEAARLVQASLRASIFLFVRRVDDDGLGATYDEIREYSVRYPDTVPIAVDDPILADTLSSDLRRLLPDGGVICIPPPDHRLCTLCRVGIRVGRTPDGAELCDSCGLAYTQTTGVKMQPIDVVVPPSPDADEEFSP